MNVSVALAVGMTRSWVALYTLGLPTSLRVARRAEIDCDLWEQRRLAESTREPPLRTAAEIAARAVLGMLSDITWRVQAGLATRPDRSTKMSEPLWIRVSLMLSVAVAVAVVVSGFGNLIFLTGDWGEGEEVQQRLYGLLVALSGAAIALGLVLAAGRPTLGTRLVIGGSVAASLLMFWVFMITIPLGLLFIGLALKRAYGTVTPWRRPQQPAP